MLKTKNSEPQNRLKNNRILKVVTGLSITNKITLMYGTIFSIVLILLTVFLMGNASVFYSQMSRKELSDTAEEVVRYISSGKSLSDASLNGLRPNEFVDFTVFNVTARKMVYMTPDQPSRFFIVSPEERPMPESGKSEPSNTYRIEAFKGIRYMHSEKYVEYNDEIYSVRVYRKYERELEILKFFAAIFIVVNILGVIGTFLIGRYFSLIILRPIVTISQTAERISIEDLSQRIEYEGPDDEIKKLVVTFNDMIDRLESSFTKQAQFVSDASHELQTPIAVIQGYANLMDRWGKSDPAVLQESIDSIKAETGHMSDLVKKLLFLTKGNHKNIKMQRLLLNEIAAEVAKELNILELSEGVLIIEEGEAWISGDYGLIKQLLWIFVENSIKYSKKDGLVEIRIFEENDLSCVSVKDYGIGICKEDVPLIFERFYRADKSRNKEIGGNGLGLSIADWIMKQHKATVRVQSELDKGTEITVRFPKDIG